jgi:Domain of unknown function (DUF4424)
MNKPSIVLAIALLGGVIAAVPATAQPKPPAEAAKTPSGPAQSSLTVGALQTGSAASLVVAAFDIHVESDNVVYSYFLKNAGAAEVGLAAAVSLPELQASADGSETWALASSDPENFISLTITAAGAPVTATAQVHAYALGIDRLADIKAEKLPLIPFGPEIDKALAALSPAAADRLAALGLVSPRDNAQKAPAMADWSLNVTRFWRQVLPQGKTIPVVIKFTPIKAIYKMTKGDLQSLDEMKDDLCMKPEAVRALQSRLQANGAWKVSEIPIATDPPARRLDSPRPTLSVQKPKPDAIIAFCGMDEKTAGKPTVLGVVPEETYEMRIVTFEPATN